MQKNPFIFYLEDYFSSDVVINDKEYDELIQKICKLKVYDEKYLTGLNHNKLLAEKFVRMLKDNSLPVPNVCVAEDGEIVFDWVSKDKEAIVSIDVDNDYIYLLLQPSGKFLSGQVALSGDLLNV